MMWRLLLFIVTLMPLFLIAQQTKGLQPESSISFSANGETYAVVVGISDYQDEDIPDLRFADRDALAFAGFLQSPAGGALDEDHLKVLINEKATVAQFAIALDWLWEVAKENDRVIIYFSGHGDVERKSITQPGYLLCWDAPAKIYLAGGALALPMFQDVISTLSVQNKAKVIVITDACRSGKLSGSAVGGAQITGSNLAKQYANEIKILSCQPDEFSIEGEQWGGGRGAFSYHLLEGLYGLADLDLDQTVSVREIERYLEDHVTLEVAPQNQLPMTIGDSREKLTVVFPDLLSKVKERKKGELPLFMATATRGIEDDVLSALSSSGVKADSNVVAMYLAFQKALEDKQFLFAEKGRAHNDFADYYYEKLIREPSLERLHSSMTRNYAAALQDDAQQVMNNWMKYSQLVDPILGEEEVRLPIKVFNEKIRAFPACLERAAKLLGSDHYMYATLQARKHFFEGYLLANSDRNPNRELGNKALAAFHKALEWQPELPQAYWQMSLVFGNNYSEPDSAEVYAQKAMELYPSWLYPYSSLVNLFSERFRLFDRAKTYLEKAMQIDSNSLAVLISYGAYHNRQKKYDEAEKAFEKAIKLDSTYAAVYNNLGNVYGNTRRYKEAEMSYKKAIQLDSTYAVVYNNLGTVYSPTRRYEEAEMSYKKAIQLDSTFVQVYHNLGFLYERTRRYEEAEMSYKKAIQLDSTFISPLNGLGIIYFETRRYAEAEELFKKAIQLDSTFGPVYVNLGRYYEKTGRNEEAEMSYKKAIQVDSTIPEANHNLGVVYKNARRYGEAEKYFKKAIQLDTTYVKAYGNLGIVYMNTQRYEEAEMSYKKAIQLDSMYDLAYVNLGIVYRNTHRYEEAEMSYKKAIQLDSTFSGNYNNLGGLFAVTDRYPEAEKNFKKAIQLDTNNWRAYINLGILFQTFQRWDETEVMIRKGIQHGPPIGWVVAMLGNAYTHMSGRMEDAKEKLDQALEMSPNSPDTYIYLAIWALKKNQQEMAWQYIEQGLEKGLGNEILNLKDLQEWSDFEPMREDPRWNSMVQHYFSD